MIQYFISAITTLLLSFSLSAKTGDKTPDKVSQKSKVAQDKNLFIQDASKNSAKYDIKCKAQDKVLKAYDCLGSAGKIAKHCVIVKGKGYVGNNQNTCKADQQSKYNCNDFTLCVKKPDFQHPTK